LLDEGEYSDAIALLDAVIAFEPQNVEALTNRGMAHSELGEYEAAITDFDAALLVDPTNGLAYEERAGLYYDVSEYELAIEDYTQAGADAKARKVSEIAAKFHGREISNSIPKIARANPFGPVNVVLGPEGERWVCSHVLVSHSNAVDSHQAILNVFEKYKTEFDKYTIETGFLFAIISSNAFVLEPVFFWPDAATEIHAEYIESEHFDKLPKFNEDLAARELVAKVRHELAALFRDRGGVHMQLGKDYHYADGIVPESLALIKAIKAAVDPSNQINPGALGLDL